MKGQPGLRQSAYSPGHACCVPAACVNGSDGLHRATDIPALLEAPSPLRAGGRVYSRRADSEARDRPRRVRLVGRVGRVQTRSSRWTVGDRHATQARLVAERYRFPGLTKMPRSIPSALISQTNRAYRSTPRRGDGGNAKLPGFHDAMSAADITRPFCDRVEGWSDPSPGATTRAGVALQILVLGRRKRA
jgi:hypothetical protein